MSKTVGILIGIMAGTIVYLIAESKVTSYFSGDSKSCANCHVMLSAYNTWHKSSHRENAVCADCHIPHENLVRAYAAKASDGLRHSFKFTFNLYPETLKTSADAKSTIQHNCIRCHENIVGQGPAYNAAILYKNHQDKDRLCWECHRNVPHGTGNSISTFQGIENNQGKAISYPK